MEKFVFGVFAGTLIGALIVANNQKARKLVQKGQQDAMQRVEEFMDEKLCKCGCKEPTEGGASDGQ